jgi:hypothetical protein
MAYYDVTCRREAVPTGIFFLYIFCLMPLILYWPPHYVSAPSTGKIFAISFFVFCTPVIRNTTSHHQHQPSTMPSVFPDTNWVCEACTHPNKEGKTCVMCQTPRPKQPKVAAPTKPPLRAGAAPPPAIEMAAASTDALLAAIPGTPGAGAAPPLFLDSK